MQRTRFFQTCFGVFQGGGCRGAAFVGALEQATARGVDFAGVAGTSAGSIVAALLGAGATPDYLRKVLQELNFMGLLEDPEPVVEEQAGLLEWVGLWAAHKRLPEAATVWCSHGLHSSVGLEKWMNARLAELLPVKPPIKFGHLPIPTYVVAADIFTVDAKTFSTFGTPEDDVGWAVRCSCSIPGFFQPVNGRYIDGGVLSNLPLFVFSEGGEGKPLANRILAFTLVQKKTVSAPPTARGDLFRAIVNTVVDGASAVQGRLVANVHEIRIDTGDIQATDFDKMDDKKTAWLMKQGSDAAVAFFQDELSKVLEALDEAGTGEIVICDLQTRWAYSIFPALLAWRMRNVRLQVILGAQPADDHERYRRRLLAALGANVQVIDQPLPFIGFLVDPQNQALARAMVFVPEGTVPSGTALRYEAPFDLPAIQALAGAIEQLKLQPTAAPAIVPRIVGVPEHQVVEKLKKYVKAYSTVDVKLTMETVPISRMVSLTRLVRGYKYKQIRSLFELFKATQLNCFETAEVRYTPNAGTLVTPPVLEYTGNRYVLVQGNTRAAYCFRNGIDEMRCCVVRGIATPLPSNQRIELKNVLIGGRTLSMEDRYGGGIDKDYRAIEWATHHPKETLLNV